MDDDLSCSPAGPDALKGAMDAACRYLGIQPDVTGMVVLVFTADRSAGSGTSVSLQLRGQCPEPERLGKLLQTLLTQADLQAHSERGG